MGTFDDLIPLPDAGPSYAARLLGPTPRVTTYSPQRGGDRMEGGYEASRPGPDGQAVVRTLEDFRTGAAPYVTIAGNPNLYGRQYTVPEVSYAVGGQRYTLRDVPMVVHDTGGAFRNAPDGRFDVPIGRDLNPRDTNQGLSGVQFVPRQAGVMAYAPEPPKPAGVQAIENAIRPVPGADPIPPRPGAQPVQPAQQQAGGLFDDLIPAQAVQAGGGLFDDLIPSQPQQAAQPAPSQFDAGSQRIASGVTAMGGYRPADGEAEKMKAAAQSSPQAERRPTALEASNRGLVQGMTMGFGDELMAGMLTPIEMGVRAYQGKDWGVGPSYDAALQRERGALQAAREDHPVATTVGDVVGGVTAGGGIAKGGVTLMNVAKPTAARMIPAAMGEGAAYGAARGFGEGEGGQNRIDSAVRGGSIGAAAGGALGAVAATLSSKAAKALLPAIDELKAKGEAAYQAADAAGLYITPSSLSRLGSDIASELRQVGYNPRLHPRIGATLEELSSLPQQPTSLRDVEIIRRIAGNAAKTQDPSEAMIASKVIDKIDDFLGNLGSADVVAGDRAGGVRALRDARQYWARYRRLDQVENAIYKAENRAASTGSGGNAENATRQNIRGILDKGARGFSEAEKSAMEKVVKGGPVQNAARLVGKLSPEGNGLMTALNVGATVADPKMAAVAVTGFGAKRLSEVLANRNIQNLLDIIRSGGQMPQVSQLPPQQQEAIGGLLRTLAQEGAHYFAPAPMAAGTTQ